MQQDPSELNALLAVEQAVRQKQGVSVTLEKLSKQYGTHAILKEIDLTIQAGEFIVIVGRSGCGKSTLLRLLAGLEKPSGGSIYFDEKKQQGLHPDTRIMFQEARLLPWKNIVKNVQLGLARTQKQAALAILDEVGLKTRAEDFPLKLSGGQRQRVALARALIHQPRLLLLDEPLGALDALTRLEMQKLIESLWQQHHFTTVLVTHDVAEALCLADRIILLKEGEIALNLPIHLPRHDRQLHPDFMALHAHLLQQVCTE